MVKERESKVRQLVKAVVHCDVTKDPPIEQGYDTLYDVVICSLVLEGASSSPEEYKSNFIHLSSLVKPGGSLLLYGVENQVGFIIPLVPRTTQMLTLPMSMQWMCSRTVDSGML